MTENGSHRAAAAESPSVTLGLLPPTEQVRKVVKVDEFGAHARALAASETGFQNEFMDARSEVLCAPGYRERLTKTVPHIRACNRYADIVCLEDTRVKLATQSEHDYINASWVRLQGLPDVQYIAAQAPLEHTFDAFWRMIWENRAPLVLMLTPWVEHAHGRSRVKAERYLPLEQDDVQVCDTFEVRCLMLNESDFDQGISVRKLSLKSLASSAPPRTVYHVHYTKWPDFGCVKDLEPYLHLHAIVRKYTAQSCAESEEASSAGTGGAEQSGGSGPTPIVTHCSAGIGRTGTYIAIDAILAWIAERVREAPSEPATLDILDVFKQLRNHRPGMVFTFEQYAMVYQVIYFALFGTSLSDATEADAKTSLESFAGMDDADIYRAKLGSPSS
ncbi:Receptor-type tyrosine-protein phosphatase [Hondaea fermentalgiana]|uniref:Receptor-type tyrosine-protein phosphatase n=1 Tax=Hondaea fermentalgiana TaxID=2315210 RepID=A0A2R5GHW0_9STRA|nr:Receptor-type tyrosine-protein phosphatase [Hondaea fermentalgiana]|eukprot:GBG30175.1 Receptor-type tyrosine-protein phosphatase [Hondaea fermentalgiana]